jgi:lipopolysaccharide biosynthesis protein
MDISKHDNLLIAFYLPQFHPVPENDEWWGKGFTEWRNVAKALPNFIGHYQPHIPADLGFYDLRVPQIREEQAELALNYGIDGFCYYYYWFDGKKILETPLEEMLKSQRPDFPFCLCWGNERWTRRWDGMDGVVLIESKYPPGSMQQFIRELFPIFDDRRYIHINDKPFIIILRLDLLPNPKETTDIWRQEAKDAGLGELYIAAIRNFLTEDPKNYGLDAMIQFSPNWRKLKGIKNVVNFEITNPSFNGGLIDYLQVAKIDLEQIKLRDYPLFPTVTTSWDNTPRRQDEPPIIYNSSPEWYGITLQLMLNGLEKHFKPGERIIFINAWNEWAEGAYLEPDLKYGHAYLEATLKAKNFGYQKSIVNDFMRRIEALQFENNKKSKKSKKSKKLKKLRKLPKYLSFRLI